MNMILVQGIITEWKLPADWVAGGPPKVAGFVDSHPYEKEFPAGTPEELIRSAMLSAWVTRARDRAGDDATKKKIIDNHLRGLYRIELNPHRYQLKAPLVL